MMCAKHRYKKRKRKKKIEKKEKKNWIFSTENIKLVHLKHWYTHSAVQIFRTDFFKNRRHITFFIQNKLHWRI